jgi:hypothetical protein
MITFNALLTIPYIYIYVYLYMHFFIFLLCDEIEFIFMLLSILSAFYSTIFIVSFLISNNLIMT